jgi:hypothetical protein
MNPMLFPLTTDCDVHMCLCSAIGAERSTNTHIRTLTHTHTHSHTHTHTQTPLLTQASVRASGRKHRDKDTIDRERKKERQKCRKKRKTSPKLLHVHSSNIKVLPRKTLKKRSKEIRSIIREWRVRKKNIVYQKLNNYSYAPKFKTEIIKNLMLG